MQGLLEKKFFLFIAGLLCFFTVVRYHGFYEDAGRYLLQVVNYLYPERFIDDVPFMFGNQDSFTFFSPLMAVVYGLVGVNYGAIVMTFVFQSAWCIGLICLLYRWCSQFAKQTWSLPIFIICISTLIFKLYGCGSYFPIIDGILVARFVAEIFMLFGFAWFFYTNRYISLMFFIAGCFIHPLMAGWGLPVWLFYYYPRSKIPILFCAIIFPLTAFLHFGTLDFLPKEWLDRPLCYAPNVEDMIIHALLLIFWASMGRFIKDSRISNLSRNIFCVCFIGLFWQYVGISMEHVFLIQVQPYRVQWLCIILAFPVMTIFVYEQRKGSTFLNVLRNINVNQKNEKIVFILGLLLLSTCAALSNYIQLVLEQGYGSISFATTFIDLPTKLIPLQKIVLCLLLLDCLIQRRFIFSVIFAYSLINGFVTLLPIFVIIFYLASGLSQLLKNFLMALTVVISIAEMLSALPNSPMQDDWLGNILFLGVAFILTIWIVWLRNVENQNRVFLPIVLFLIAIAVWNVFKWDARNEEMQKDERQMDAFFQKPVFPQVLQRGKILFVENGEFPLQSRFKFLTGTYADETINIGEVFFEKQFKEARHRKNMLLNGDSVLRDMNDYRTRISNLYKDKYTLVNRTEYLCQSREITHLVTDYGDIPFNKSDSAYLNVKKKYVYLYECPN